MVLPAVMGKAPLFEGGREALLSRGVSYYDPFAVNPADEETDYDYDQENRLVHVSMPTDIEVMFSYDGVGRRLIKEVVDDTGDDTVTTTWKYHYVKGQITTIEIDAVEDDGETQTAVRDETLHIHFGPNALPISFEWERYDYDTSTTLTDTYYYHFDVHGNLLKVTDDSATTKIYYDYDVLGEISSVTNPDGITNPFAWGGSSQIIYDDIIGMYSNQAGFYRTDVGTLLGGGAPVFTNPTSGHVVNKITTTNTSSKQMKSNRFKVVNNGGEPLQANGSLWDLYRIIKDIFGSGNSDIRRHFEDRMYEPRLGGFGKLFERGIDINSPTMISFIEKFGIGCLEEGVSDGHITEDQYNNGRVETIDGAFISLKGYITSLASKSLGLANSLIGTNESEGSGPVGYRGLGNANQGDLGAIIMESALDFDIKNGGAIAHRTCRKGNKSLREEFFKQLVNDIENDPDFEIDFDNMGEFAQEFQQTFGDLPDTDGDGYPDVVDIDDDGDGVNDKIDDDDDNDGCLDRDEKDGNTGGETGDLTGKGRGDGACDWMPEEVKPDDPDYDPPEGSTRRNDTEDT